MTIAEMKEIKPDFLKRARHGGFVCPVCGNGSGEDGTGIERKPGSASYHCFKCGFHGDVIDLFGAYAGITDEKEKIPAFKRHYGIPDDAPDARGESPRRVETGDAAGSGEKGGGEPPDFLAYIKECAAANDGSTLSRRGISPGTQKRFLVGYDPAWRSPKAVDGAVRQGRRPEDIPATPRVIIPRSRRGYLARDARDDVPSVQERYAKMSVGPAALFNSKALEAEGAVFVVEGEIDALSLCEVGFPAVVALCSVSNARLLVQWLEGHPDRRPAFLLMLDNDEPGRKAQLELGDALREAGAVCREVAYPGKDPNALLMSDPRRLRAVAAEALLAATEPVFKSAGTALDHYKNIEDEPPIFEAKTGFNCLDDENRNLYGGLHEGFYVLGALSGEGKSTFCLQLACQTARLSGTPALFFAQEQTLNELVARCLSRETYINARAWRKAGGKGELPALNFEKIRNGGLHRRYTDEEERAYREAISSFEEYAQGLYIMGKDALTGRDGEGRLSIGQISVDFILRTVDAFIRRTGMKPLVVADYLQVLKPDDPRLSEKAAMDRAVYRLQGLASEYGIPVLAVSSFNREAYYEPVDLTSFKESGGIEYSADFLFGLQQVGMDYAEGGEDSAGRKKRIFELHRENNARRERGLPVEMELKCLKSRNGPRFSARLDYVAAFNVFLETVDEFVSMEGRETPFDGPGERRKAPRVNY